MKTSRYQRRNKRVVINLCEEMKIDEIELTLNRHNLTENYGKIKK